MSVLTDPELAYEALAGKAAEYDRLWRYYDGKHPLVYSTERLRQIFKHIDARFSENWCAVVIDAMLDRISLQDFAVANDTAATDTLNSLFATTGLQLDAHDAHLASLVTGESFIVCWPDDTGAPQAYYNDPRMCHAFYDAENPRLMRMAAKWWVGSDGLRYLTLYYPERIEYYVSRGKASELSSGRAFTERQPAAANPYGQIPVFHLRRERRGMCSELANVIEPQNAINKLVADMMIAAEFGAAPQRYIISNADTGDLQNAPNLNWSIPAGDGVGQQTQVGQLEATQLSNFIQAIDKFTTALAVISRTPKHFLFAQGGDPSGEALIAMEAPLNAKCQRFVDISTVTWREVAAFLLRLAGNQVDPQSITPGFAEVATVQPRTRAEIRKLSVEAGLPLVTVLRDEGWTEEELAEMQDDQDADRKAQQDSLAGALLEQQRRFDQGQQPGTGQPVTTQNNGQDMGV